jgi:hypothetical protein
MDSVAVSVTDAFDIKPNTPGSNHEPGLVVIFDGRQCAFRLPALGTLIELLLPNGQSRTVAVSEIKEHGDGRSFFFAALTRADAPLGTILSWSVPASKESRSVNVAVA